MSAPKDQPPNLKLRFFTCCFIAIVYLLAAFPPTSAAGDEPIVIYVNKKISVSGNGESWETAFKDLQDALTEAEKHIPEKKIEIWVEEGTYKPANLSCFDLLSNVALYGGFKGTEIQRSDRDYETNVTTLNGSGKTVVRADGMNETSVLDGFTITGGNASMDYSGGGMYILHSSPTVTNCTFLGNNAIDSGGGMYIEDSSPKLTNCDFSGNSADASGGGMYVNGSSPMLTNCTFSGNNAAYGGGMYVTNSSSPTVTNCDFSGNNAFSSLGGGMYIENSSPTVTNCTFSENTATSDGGGAYVNGGYPMLTNCTFSGNTATTNGGGMFIYSGNPTVRNCTFEDNKSDYSGDGLYISSGNPKVTNTIFWGEFSATGQVADQSNNLTITYSVVDTVFFSGEGNTKEDPKLGPLADNGGPTKTCALLEGSSAIDSGTASGAPTTDQRGVPRPQGAGVDMGAYEYGVGTLTVTINPEKARTDGAKWSHDDGVTWQDSGVTVHLVPGDYTVTFNPIDGWTEPADQNIAVTEGQLTQCTGIYTELGTLTVTITPAGALAKGAQWSYDGGNTWRTSGELVYLTPVDYTVTFKTIDGWTTPGDIRIDIMKDVALEETVTYVRHTGSLTVTTSPAVAGGKWKIDGVTDWRNSGEMVADLSTGVYTVTFSDVPGWITPDNKTVTVSVDQQKELDVLYRAEPIPFIPVPVQPVTPPDLPSGMNLPDGSSPSSAAPLTAVLSEDPLPGQKKQTIEEALQAAGLPRSLTESLADLLDMDRAGQVYISDDGMESFEELLDSLDIPEDALRASLPVFTASLAPGATTAVVYFHIPAGFIGKPSYRLQAVKILSSDQAKLFKRVHSVEELADGCCAVVEVDGDGLELRGVLKAEDLIDVNSRLALAIKDGGPFDLDGEENGSVTDPVFILEALVKETGALTVTVAPPEAEGMWKIMDVMDWRDSGDTITGLFTGSYTVTFSPLPDWTAPDDIQVDITKDVTLEKTVDYVRHTGALTVAVSPAEAEGMWKIDGVTDWLGSGETTLLPTGSYAVTFSPLSDWTAPDDIQVDIMKGVTLEKTVDYVRHTGSLTVAVSPAEAGGMWKIDGVTDWLGSGETALLPTGSYAVTFSPLSDWTAPDDIQVDIMKGVTLEKTVDYVRHTGSLTVAVSPAEAGGMWKIDGVTDWLGSGESTLLPTGVYTVTFSHVPGWIAPGDETATVSPGQQTELDVAYRAVPVPVPVQPVAPPDLPSGMNLPDGSSPSSAAPLTAVLSEDPLPGQKKQTIEEALQAAGLPRSLTESLADLLDMDRAGQIYISDDGMESLEELLDGLDIPEDALRASLPVFTASPIPAGNTAVVYFHIPEGFAGKPSYRLQAVKILSSGQVELFKRVHSAEELADGCSAVVEVDGDGLKLRRVLGEEDLIDVNSRLALAIKDGGPFDLDGRENGSVTDPAFILEAVEKFDSSGGGCAVGPSSVWMVALLAPLAPLAFRRSRKGGEK